MALSYEPSLQLDKEQIAELCAELRERILRTVSQSGGHLASNLGAVELTVALHCVFDTGQDRVVFDVGHQSYAHKLLTGRDASFDTLRSFGGVAGFPKPSESVHDACIAGHASNSVSVALGMARARTLRQENYHVIAVIGDGALTGGLAYEGLSDAGESNEDLIVILNDNGMSITENVGSISHILAKQRLRPRYRHFKRGYQKAMKALPGGKRLYMKIHRLKTAIKQAFFPMSIFESLGFSYYGPVDGHDTPQMIHILEHVKRQKGPSLVHIRTVKGKGYAPAEASPDQFHGVSNFDLETGAIPPGDPSFSSAFGAALCRLAEQDERICAITAAMTSGTGLNDFSARFPDRFFDVGIAEGHAVAMAAGMASQGAIPVFAVYSTFLQRGFDMLLHDVAISGLHVVFCVDRAGLVGADGETHQGLFDVGYLGLVPGMTVYAPSSFAELSDMLEQAVLRETGPVALRYSRGGEGTYSAGWDGSAVSCVRSGRDLTIVTYGEMLLPVLAAAEKLAERGIEAEVIKLNRIYPTPFDEVIEAAGRTGRLLVAEAVVNSGSIGQRLAAELAARGVNSCAVRLVNLGDRFIPHGSVGILRREYGIDAAGICRAGEELCRRG